jgi:hypothetical protein
MRRKARVHNAPGCHCDDDNTTRRLFNELRDEVDNERVLDDHDLYQCLGKQLLRDSSSCKRQVQSNK